MPAQQRVLGGSGPALADQEALRHLRKRWALAVMTRVQVLALPLAV
jgi:hypothetical protein